MHALQMWQFESFDLDLRSSRLIVFLPEQYFDRIDGEQIPQPNVFIRVPDPEAAIAVWTFVARSGIDDEA